MNRFARWLMTPCNVIEWRLHWNINHMFVGLSFNPTGEDHRLWLHLGPLAFNFQIVRIQS